MKSYIQTLTLFRFSAKGEYSERRWQYTVLAICGAKLFVHCDDDAEREFIVEIPRDIIADLRIEPQLAESHDDNDGSSDAWRLIVPVLRTRLSQSPKHASPCPQESVLVSQHRHEKS